jgi:hypothetical protein
VSTFQAKGQLRVTLLIKGYEITNFDYERIIFGKPTMNLKNIDWKHIVLIVATVLLAVYSTLLVDGVPLPAQLASVAAALTSIVNWLNGSPVATPQQIASKTTRADLRALTK